MSLNSKKVATIIESTGSPFSAFKEAWEDLICKKRAGHMGMYEYENGSMDSWDEYIHDEEAAYYPVKAELELASSVEKLKNIISRIKGDITIVSRGSGTMFKYKDGAFAKLLEANGARVVKIIYMDVSASALTHSLFDGAEMFPNAEQEAILGDMFKSDVCYEIAEGSTEVNTLFGLTRDNVEGFMRNGAPQEAYLEMSRNIYAQMSESAHFICTTDTNQDAASIEECYEGQTGFALGMLANKKIDTSKLDFEVGFDADSHILAHYFVAKENYSFGTEQGIVTLKAGDKLHFNTSLKLPLTEKLLWERIVGFKTLDAPQAVPFDASGRVALLHLQK